MPSATPTTAPVSNPPSEVRSVDRDLLLALRGEGALGVGELTQVLGVTATAVRQRIERLLSMGLIEREKVVAGRGRPTFRYRLTIAGHRQAGADLAVLADALWEEIVTMPDSEARERLLSGVATRLGRQFAEQMRAQVERWSVEDEDAPLADRLERLSAVLTSRQVETGVSQWGDLPVLDLGSCPYPSLTEASEDRAMCRLEEKMFSEALGQPVHLSRCRLDGDQCCQFSPVIPQGLVDEAPEEQKR